MIAGGDCIDDTDVLRAGESEAVLGHRVMAPSTCGTFLRSFSFGHVRQLDAWSEFALTGAWAAGAGPGDAPMTIDIDSTICETHGYQKRGASFGYTKARGYHPLLATRAETGEILHVRFRKGSANTGRGAERFVRETIGRVRRAGSTGPLRLRADSGFSSKKVIKACRDHGVGYSITVRQVASVKTAIAAIDEEAWIPIDYTIGGDAEVAECPFGDGHRLVVRRTQHPDPRPPGRPVRQLASPRLHHRRDRHHRRSRRRSPGPRRRRAHTRDLKEGAGLEHCPSGRFHANGAWAVLATVAHNLLRWIHLIGTGVTGPIVAKTLRRKLLITPGQFTRGGRPLQGSGPCDSPRTTAADLVARSELPLVYMTFGTVLGHMSIAATSTEPLSTRRRAWTSACCSPWVGDSTAPGSARSRPTSGSRLGSTRPMSSTRPISWCATEDRGRRSAHSRLASPSWWYRCSPTSSRTVDGSPTEELA